MKYINVIFLLIIIGSSSVNAQDLSFVNYSTKEGMSSAQVYQIFQDVNGDMLFATDRGITKYDGYEFETFDLVDGLTNTTVFNFFPQSNGDIWCSTINNSWFLFENGTTEFKACSLNSLIQKASKGAQVEDFWIDINGDMYFGFQNHSGFLKISGKSKTVEHSLVELPQDYDSITANFIKNTDWFTFYETESNPSYLKGKEKVTIKKARIQIRYKKIKFVNQHFLFSADKNLTVVDNEMNRLELEFNSTILGIGKFDDSHFWLGLSDGGVKIIDMHGKESKHWLKSTSPTSLLIDSNGDIWVSTLNNGVFYAQSDKLVLYNSISNNYIYSISPGVNKNPLVTTLSSYYQYNGKSLEPITFSKQGKFEPVRQKSAYNSQTKKYRYFVGSNEITDNTSLNSEYDILDFSENTERPMLIAAPYAILKRKGDHFIKYKSSVRITAIEYANNGFLVGGYNGLQLFNSSTSEYEKTKHEELSGRITDIKQKEKIHFIGTNGAGLIKYNQKEDKINQILKKDGLASNLINEVFAEFESVVWVATNAGLDRVTFHATEYSIKHFGVEHGLIDNDVTDVYVNNNTIWIGTRTGLCSISKKEFEATTIPNSIHLFWKNIVAENQTLSSFSNIILAHDQNNIELNFHSAFYGGSSRVKYRYKLSEGDDKWHQVKNRIIILNSLPPGKYHVILQANIDNTNWSNNQLEANFIILPPFYITWWFRLLIFALITLIIYLFFRFRVLIYNRSLAKEILRLIIRKINPQIKSFVIQEQGKDHRINSMDVFYLKSDGNYLTIQLKDNRFTVRHKIGEFAELVPDRLEYLRVHKSYVVRKDKISGKNIDRIYLNDFEIPIGKIYKKALKDLVI
ncbi:MAG: LytTR family transcriptional regulator DNA-binding domain-containing protein [Crocinitomicaceae bacterium]